MATTTTALPQLIAGIMTLRLSEAKFVSAIDLSSSSGFTPTLELHRAMFIEVNNARHACRYRA